MKLSIIIPVYNSENFLDKCLASIVNQNYKNIEIILINDGSKDNSKKIINKYLKANKQIIKYIEQENSGQAHARNRGLEIATGDLITFVDSDDYVLPEIYQEMIKALTETDADIAICDIYLEKNNIRKVYHATKFDNLFSSSVSLCNKVFKKELLQNERFLEGIWYEDYNFFVKICLKNPTYVLCEKPLYVYVTHDNSTMNNNNSIKNLDIIKATEDILKMGVSEEVRDTLIINHILVDTINRVYNQKSKEKKEVIKKLNKYIHKNIKNIFKTKEYKNSSLTRKIILILNYFYLGKISNILLKINKELKND